MRKMKKINGYLVVRFNDREKREHEGIQRHMKGTKVRRYRHWPVCYTRIGYRRQMVLRQLCHL